jgi:hypothetical protein
MTMKTFKQFIAEAPLDPKSKTLHAFDMDDTLFHHDDRFLKVHVVDQHGRIVRSLNNREFNNDQLKPGESYDFKAFKSSRLFAKSAHPIRPMLAKLKAIHKQNKNVEILTARSDLKDKDLFGRHLARHGIDINKVHVRRAGNLPGDPATTKRQVLSDLIKQHGYNAVHFYDDSERNVQSIAQLKQDHPHVDVVTHHVQHEGGKVKIKTQRH